MSSNLLGICSVISDSAKETKLFLDLSNSLPVDKHAQMAHISTDKLFLYLPSYDTLCLLSPHGGTSQMLRFGKQKQTQYNPPRVLCGENNCLYFCGDTFLRILNVDKELETVSFPERGTIRPIGNQEFLFQAHDANHPSGLVLKCGQDWVWKEIQDTTANGGDWSVHRVGANPSSYVQSLDHNLSIWSSPKPVSRMSPVMAYSPTTVCSAFPTELELANLKSKQIRTIPLASPCSHVNVVDEYVYTVSTLSNLTQVVKYDGNSERLSTQLGHWKQMWGLPTNSRSELKNSGGSQQQLEAQKTPPKASQPKHGKEDNLPHVGGNTWAGGTGGSDTAGLGGRGGPYRLDKGDPIHQLSDEVKRQVDNDVAERAKQLGKLAFQERLREIDMNPEVHRLYQAAKDRVQLELEMLQSIVRASDAQKKERVWAKNQSFGELDDAKLVDGLCGERQIYKRRVWDKTATSVSPINLRLVVDISASMYRFQSLDGRLQRMVDSTLMLLEAFRDIDRFRLSVVGHSGEDPEVMLVPWDELPQDEGAIYKILERMTAHAQYCLSGDTTVEALNLAIKQVLKEDDEQGGIVIVVSDANLRRYGIPPSALAKEMKRNADKVTTHVIFLASVRDEAETWVQELPQGKGRICLQTSDLPHVMREILTDYTLSLQ